MTPLSRRRLLSWLLGAPVVAVAAKLQAPVRPLPIFDVGPYMEMPGATFAHRGETITPEAPWVNRFLDGEAPAEFFERRRERLVRTLRDIGEAAQQDFQDRLDQISKDGELA